MYKIEICANSVVSCLAAQEGGAYRVELCAGIPEGGTTPSYGEILLAREKLGIKLHVIIRPRGGDFLYSSLEKEIMLKDIENVRRLGVDGIVTGCLLADGEVDIDFLKEMKAAAGTLSVNFHRAFDMCRNPYHALEQLIEAGCERVLTSGLRASAEQGIPVLKELIEQADGRIVILPGCGINEDNIVRIAQETGAEEFHLSVREAVQSDMKFRNPEVSMGGVVKTDEYEQAVTSAERVKNAVLRLQTFLGK